MLRRIDGQNRLAPIIATGLDVVFVGVEPVRGGQSLRTGHYYAEAEYRAERRKLEAMLVELPLPADAGLVAFDRAAALYEDIGAILSDTTREHQRQIVLAIVESVRATEGGVSEIRVRPEARPFFGYYVAGEAATDDEEAQRAAVGSWRPRTDSNRRRAA